jgi:hypothetical protein
MDKHDTASTARVLRGLVELARPMILELVYENSCILSTRIAIDVLDHFGIDAEPLVVRATVSNAVFARLCVEHGELPDGPLMDRWEQEHGAWVLGLGVPAPPGTVPLPRGWPGHLVAVVQRRLLLDLSLDQVNRPERGIGLGPLILPCRPDFLAGRQPFATLPGGCLVLYDAFPDDRSWHNSPDRAKGRWDRLTGAVIRKVRDYLAVGRRFDELLEAYLSTAGASPDGADPQDARYRELIALGPPALFFAVERLVHHRSGFLVELSADLGGLRPVDLPAGGTTEEVIETILSWAETVDRHVRILGALMPRNPSDHERSLRSAKR